MNLNVNKLFPFLSIRSKLIIAFTLLSFLPLSVIGLIGLSLNIRTLDRIAMDDLTHDLEVLHEKAESFLKIAAQDIQYLTATPVFREFLQDLKHSDTQGRNGLSAGKVAEDLLTFAAVKKNYYQLHFVSKEGNEIFNIRKQGNHYEIISAEHLSTSRFLFYFLLTDSLEKGRVAFVPTELLSPTQSMIPA